MKTNEFTGKKCYDHLGGKLGAALFEFLVQQEWIRLKQGTPTAYIVTEKGYDNFLKMGLELPRVTIQEEGNS